jgi:translation initiation factor IF-3
MRNLPPPVKDGPRVNRDIRVREVQVIDAEGNNLGTLQTLDAVRIAEEEGLDLVEVAPNSVPPVCKIMDYGRFRFQEQKKAAEARKKQKVIEIKEIKLRPGIDDHDFEIKMKAAKGFFEEGNKVKFTLRFRGREMAHQQIGMRVFDKIKELTVDYAKVENEPSMEGRQAVMVVAPK